MHWQLYRDGAISSVHASNPVDHEDEPRVMIDEQPIPKLGGPTYKQIRPKTYQVLEETLPPSDETDEASTGRLNFIVSFASIPYFFHFPGTVV